MSKTVIFNRTLEEPELRELVIDGMKRRGFAVKSVVFSTQGTYSDEGSRQGYQVVAGIQIELPDRLSPTQEQWNGGK